MNLRTATALLAGTVLSASALAGPSVAVAPAVQQQISNTLLVQSFDVQALDIRAGFGGRVQFEVSLDGQAHQILLAPHSLRTQDYVVKVQQEDGSLVEIDAPRTKTFRGVIPGTDAVVAGSIIDGQFTGLVLKDDMAWSIQPVREIVPGAAADQYVIHRADDSLPTGLVCGGGIVADGFVAADQPVGQNSTRGAGTFLVCELGIDADFQFYQRNGNSEANTIADIENVMNSVAAIYERDTGITFTLNAFIVRTSSASNPYTTNNADTLLGQFRSEWRNNQTAIQRDLAHLFTGRNIDGGTIGIAFLSAVCSTTTGYGLSESRFTTNFNNRVALTAHELGHNFSAQHCDSLGNSNCFIMCAGLGGCGGFTPPGISGPGFGADRAGRIATYAAGRGCLDQGSGNQLLPPVLLGFDSGTSFEPTAWEIVNGATISTAADNEPSAPNSANLDSNDSIQTTNILAASTIGTPTFASMFVQHKGVEAGETLVMQYRDFLGNWFNLITVTSDGTSQTEFVRYEAQIPFQGQHDQLALRIIANGNEANDDWYVDDVRVGQFEGAGVPWSDQFESGIVIPFRWSVNSGAMVSTAGVNEVSGTNSLNLDALDSIESASILLTSQIGNTIYARIWTQHRGVEAGKSLRFEYLDFLGNWQLFTEVVSDGIDQNEFQLHQFTVPILGFSDAFRVRIRAIGIDGTDDWYIDDAYVGPEELVIDEEPCPVDFNEDGTLDFFDVSSFLAAFANQAPIADWNGDGVWDFFDVSLFLGEFSSGCP